MKKLLASFVLGLSLLGTGAAVLAQAPAAPAAPTASAPAEAKPAEDDPMKALQEAVEKDQKK